MIVLNDNWDLFFEEKQLIISHNLLADIFDILILLYFLKNSRKKIIFRHLTMKQFKSSTWNILMEVAALGK